MTKFEFADILRSTLSVKLSSSEVEEHVRYYNEYIDGRIRMGESEEDVLASLGDPRLLARTIIDTSPGAEERAEGEQAASGGDPSQKTGRFPRLNPFWVALFLAVVVLFVILSFVGAVIYYLAPVLIPLLLILWFINVFKRGGFR